MSKNLNRPPARACAPRLPAILAVSVMAIAALANGCSSSGSGPSPTPPPPLVSPVPNTVSVDLDLADRLYVQGETDRALEIYSAAVIRGAPDDKQEAVWKVARIQYEKGDHRAASQNAQAFLGTTPDAERQRQALLLLGYSEMAQGRNQTAKDAFEAYVKTAGPSVPYADLQLAELAARDGDNKSAVQLAGGAVAADLPDAVRTEALFSLARYQETSDDKAAAASTYQELADNGNTASDRAEALWNLAAVARETRDDAREQQALYDLIVSYPAEDRALEALNGSTLAGAADRAYVLFRHRVNADATAAYEALAADADPVVRGRSQYYLGILAERAGDPGEALNQYGAAIESLTGTGASLLGDAYWDRGLVFESAGRLEEAAQHYAAIADVAAGNTNAAEGLFRAGLMRYRQGLAADAIALWQRYADAASGVDDARASYWLAKASALQGDFLTQAQQLEAAAAAAPLSYYGLRARALLRQEAPPEDPPAVPTGVPDWAGIETWLRVKYGPEDSVAQASFVESAGWQRGTELLGAALFQQASNEIGPLADAAPNPWVRYRIARAMYEAGQIRLAARAAGPLLVPDSPVPVLALVYPARFISQANEAAALEQVSPFLLLALVRQESFFDAAAVSPAGAMGLTQVVSPTAADIAAELDVTGFKDADLLSPDVSLRFGAHYLASQIEGFGGNLHAALAAYNGGPGNAGRWAEASGGDPDLLLESIDFPETRVYVEVVLENYALYRYAYGAADHPSLP